MNVDQLSYAKTDIALFCYIATCQLLVRPMADSDNSLISSVKTLGILVCGPHVKSNINFLQILKKSYLNTYRKVQNVALFRPI